MIARLLALAGVCLAAMAGSLSAADFHAGGVTVSDAWARATPGPMKTGAAYLTITFSGEGMDRLVAASTPVAKRARLHTHLMENNVMKMRPVDAIEVHAGSPTVFRPGGMHLMLMGLDRPLREGDTFPLTLTFEKAGEIQVNVMVGRIGAMGPGETPHDMKGHDGHMGGHRGMRHGS